MGKLLPYLHKNRIEAGCDEAGRGCLAGPVVAASVILPEGFDHILINDSKKLTESKRNILREVIEKEALSYVVEFVHEREIEKINILNASIAAMTRAAKKLQIEPEHLLIDGNRFHPIPNLPHTCIVKGDGKYMSIAAASILAKTYRDEYMMRIHNEFPHYQWDINKGYPTEKHRNAIRVHGSCIYHRTTFNLLPAEQLSLFG